jgi:hypothetical protein
LKMHFSKLLIPVLLLSALAVAATVASAHTTKAQSRVSIAYNENQQRFNGHVRSRHAVCKRFRQVQVWQVRRNYDQLVGTDTANRNGFWKLDQNVSRGQFYAKVTRDRLSPAEHVHICLADRSSTIRVR